MSRDYKYWAFISYSHQDTAWAEWLHKALETYRVPSRLVGKAGTFGPRPARLIPIFRDRDELPASAGLSDSIHRALEASRYLIVVCSPRSAASRYVNEEVRAFKAMGREQHVLCLIVDGEPNLTGEGACLPDAVRDSEPIAADAREGKDGRANALLKLLAGMLELGFDELRQRELARQLRQRIARAGAAVSGVAVVALAYVVIADAGAGVPAGEPLRIALDRHGVSLMRAPHAAPQVAGVAKELRRKLAVRLLEKEKAGQYHRLGGSGHDMWSTANAIAGILYSPDLDEPLVREALATWERIFISEPPVQAGDVRFGWMSNNLDYTQAEPTFWAISVLSRALERPGLVADTDRTRYLAWLDLVLSTVDVYAAAEDGRWNMLPRQSAQSRHSNYTSVVALQALLDLKRAGLPWRGSVERRDALISRTVSVLVGEHVTNAGSSGWLDHDARVPIEGLSLQIYATLLRAAEEAGAAVPREFRDHVYEYLVRIPGRAFIPNKSAGGFRVSFVPHSGAPRTIYTPVNFLWYPWTLDAAQRWLAVAERNQEAPERITRAQRAIGYLVVDLRASMLEETAKEWPYISAETLIALAGL